MIKKISIYAVILLFASSVAFSQESKIDTIPKAKDQTPKYNLLLKYPLNTFVIYEFSEQSSVRRMKDEKAEILSYDRDVSYFFKHRMNEFVKDGFSYLKLGIDSLKYSFKKNDKTTTFSSTIPDDIYKWNEDIEQYFIPLSRNFELVINPYYEISDLKGDNIKKDLKYLQDNKDITNEEDYILNSNALSNNRLLQICDPKKIDFISGEIKVDTTWKSVITYQIEGFTFNDTINVKLTDQRSGYLFIESEFKPKTFENSPSIIYAKRKSPCYLDSTDLTAKIVITMSPYGLVDETVMSIRGKIMLHDSKESFIELIDVKYKWKQLGQWRY